MNLSHMSSKYMIMDSSVCSIIFVKARADFWMLVMIWRDIDRDRLKKEDEGKNKKKARRKQA